MLDNYILMKMQQQLCLPRVVSCRPISSYSTHKLFTKNIKPSLRIVNTSQYHQVSWHYPTVCTEK